MTRLKVLALIALLTPSAAAAQALAAARDHEAAIRKLELSVGASDFDPVGVSQTAPTSRNLLDLRPAQTSAPVALPPRALPNHRGPATLRAEPSLALERKRPARRRARTRRGLFSQSVASGARLGLKPGLAAANWYHDKVIAPVTGPARDILAGRTKAGPIKKVAVGTGTLLYSIVNLPIMWTGYIAGGLMGLVGAIGGSVVGTIRAITNT